jgi:hypothetical protein
MCFESKAEGTEEAFDEEGSPVLADGGWTAL